MTAVEGGRSTGRRASWQHGPGASVRARHPGLSEIDQPTDHWISPEREERPMSATSFPKLPPQDALPFPPKGSGSIAGRTMQESTYSPRPEPRRLPEGAPNILVVLIDDA